MLFHRGLQNLWWQVQEIRANLAHQNNGPFHKARHLGQKASIFDQFQPRGEGHLTGLVPNGICAFISAQDHMGTFQLGFIILKTADSKGIRGHEAMAARFVTRHNIINLEGHNACARLIGQEA